MLRNRTVALCRARLLVAALCIGFAGAQGPSTAFAKAAPPSQTSSTVLPDPGPLAADAKSGSLQADELARKITAAREALSAEPALVTAAEASSPERSGHSISTPSGMPIAGVSLSSNYGVRMHPILGTWSQHHGVDLTAGVGTPVRATADGTITQAEWAGNYGLLVKISHGGHMETRYAHLSLLGAAEGQRVRKGDVIGFVGSTGRSTGPHLHYEVRIAGTSIDPIPFLAPRNDERARDHQRAPSAGEVRPSVSSSSP